MSGERHDADQNGSRSSVTKNILSGDEISAQSTETPSSPQETINSVDVSSSQSSHHGSLEKIPTTQDETATRMQVARTNTDGPLYSVFTRHQKIFIVFMASWAGFFSPVSGQIYFPALNALARDLNVSNSLINLTLTSYMVAQALDDWPCGH
jgi:hypothetical protein